MAASKALTHQARFDEDAIPPVIRILLNESLPNMQYAPGFIRRFKRLVPELKSQAEWTKDNFRYFDADDATHDELVAVTSGGLDPLSTQGSCQELRCRVNAAETIARTLGLYANVVLVPDHITNELNKYWTNSVADHVGLLTQMAVIHALGPMIRGGVVRFWSSSVAICASCKSSLDERVSEAASEIVGRRKIKAGIENDMLVVDTSFLNGTPGLLRQPLTPHFKRQIRRRRLSPDALAKKLYIEAARQAVHVALLDLKYSEGARGCLFSTARQPLQALRAFDQAAPALRKVAAWESSRSIELPWVEALSARQVMQLREEASEALPVFRETFVHQVAMANGDIPAIAEKIELLREEASAVSRELYAATKRDRLFRGTYGILGMATAIYAAATGEATAGTLGLLSVLGLLHRTDEGPHAKASAATSSPGYVLVKARQLAKHAPN